MALKTTKLMQYGFQIAQRIMGLTKYIRKTFPNSTVLVGHMMPQCADYIWGNMSNYRTGVQTGIYSERKVLVQAEHPLLPASPQPFEINKYLRRIMPPESADFKFVDCTGFLLNGTDVVTKYMYVVQPSKTLDCVHPGGPGAICVTSYICGLNIL